MSTTVTTTTVATVVSSGMGVALGAALAALLILLLVARELATASERERAVRWGRVLTIGIAPLAVSFVLTVIVRALAVL